MHVMSVEERPTQSLIGTAERFSGSFVASGSRLSRAREAERSFCAVLLQLAPLQSPRSGDEGSFEFTLQFPLRNGTPCPRDQLQMLLADVAVAVKQVV